MLQEIHTSKMTGKLESLTAISDNTVTNGFCYDRYIKAKAKNDKAGKVVDICGVCYSHVMLGSYRKNMQPALSRNEHLAERLLERDNIPTYLVAFKRLDAHGELRTETVDSNGNITKRYGKFTHIENFCRIAEHNPHCTFTLWTKRADIIKPFFDTRDKPNNLIIVYSNPKVGHIMAKPPKHFDKTFNNVLEHEYVDEQNCTGQKCKDCLLCYKHGTTDTIVEMVKKY